MRVNLDACIQCGLCVRACREVQVNDVIGMAGRGHDAYPVFDFDDPMGDSTCVACGECVQACPTGALMPATVLDERSGRQRRFRPRGRKRLPVLRRRLPGQLKVKDGKIKYVEGINGPANEGRLCVKGRFGFDYIHHPHRLTKPLIRREDAPAKGLNVDPGQPLDPFPRSDLGRGAGRRRRPGALRGRRPRWRASARPNAPTKRPICSRS
jgi:formate dehydrogenase major subunit